MMCLPAIRREHSFPVGQVAEKTVAVDDAPDHAIEVGPLIFAQQVGEVRYVVVAADFDALAEPFIVEPGPPLFQSLSTAKCSDQVAVQGATGDLCKVMKVADFVER